MVLRALQFVRANLTGYDAVRVVAAIVFLVAAATKCYQSCSGPIPGTGLLSERWLVICLVEAELVAALVILAGYDPVRRFSVLISGRCFAGTARHHLCAGVLETPAAVVICLVAFSVVMGCSRNEGSGSSTQSVAFRVERSPDIAKPVTSASLASRTDPLHSIPHSTVQSHASSGVPTLTSVYAPNRPSLSGCCHILLYYGLGPTDLPSFKSGDLALKALTDERAAVACFGKSPFIRTRHGLRYLLAKDPVFHSDVGESHRDQCLATFAALDLPLESPISLDCRSYSVSDLLCESIANFSFDQKELSWTALAYAKYLPPQKEWVSRFGEQTSFSQLVGNLIHRDLNRESCAGTHVFQALVQIDNADRVCSIIDDATRAKLDSYLTFTLRTLVQRQNADGSWGWEWSESISDSGRMTAFEKKFLVTGHLMEVLVSLDPRWRPPGAVYARAAEWLRQSLCSAEIRRDGSWICPFTHAARVVSELRLRPVLSVE